VGLTNERNVLGRCQDAEFTKGAALARFMPAANRGKLRAEAEVADVVLVIS